MANFEVNLTVQGADPVVLPVTALDELIMKLAGLEAKIFRFSIQNILPRPVNLSLAVGALGDDASSKLSVVLDMSSVSIAPSESATVTATITALAPLTEVDSFNVKIVGSEA